MNESELFDVVIVGAGSAGAILASRLSEDHSRSVLLLEAGQDYRAPEAPPAMRSANPLGIMDPKRFPAYTWPNLLVKRTPAQQLRVYDRGRGLGGSSAINWQVAHRAMIEDYDLWADHGCEGWSGEELLPAMNRLENDLDFGDAPYHGRNGPVSIARPPVSRWGSVDLALLEVGLGRGYQWHDDLNAPKSTGICATPLNRVNDNRVSTNDAYLEPARNRPNLTICCGVQVDRVMFEGSRAVGVKGMIGRESVEFRGDLIILSAGSVFSPTILMRSGIGPADHLRQIGIEASHDLPVGQNLVDHASVGVQLYLNESARCTSIDERNSNLYIRFDSGMAGAGRNDMMISSRNLNGYDESGLLRGAMAVALWQTFSRGELHLKDSDPFSMPTINQHLLSDDRDLIRLRAGARQLFEIAQGRVVQAVADDVALAQGVTGVTSLRIADVRGDRDLDRWMMESVRDTWHLVGTCRMGHLDDRRTVVDPMCRVLGVDSLRVIDGSIMPDVPRANTNLPCMAIAEHMAAKLA